MWKNLSIDFLPNTCSEVLKKTLVTKGQATSGNPARIFYEIENCDGFQVANGFKTVLWSI